VLLMVRIDFEKMAERARKSQERLMKKRDRVYELAETNREKLLEKKLYASVIPVGSAGVEYGFRGELSLRRCFFDKGVLKDASGAVTFDSTEGFPRGLYQCKKCRMLYDIPLNERDKREYDKRMKTRVFA